MKAKLLPLEGKYYGSTIEIDMERNYPDNILHIEVWYNGNYEPSERELAKYDVSQEEWDLDKLREPRDYGLYGIIKSAKELLDICDSHFESKETYELCNKIIHFLNTNDLTFSTNKTEK